MKSEIIIMLTHNDQTVKNAIDEFEICKYLPVKYWGFKDVGLPAEQMKELVASMKAAGKTTFLEVVTYSEGECMRGAKLAVELGFDYLLGTLYYESVWEYLKTQPIKYYPFVGEVSGSPSILEGTTQGMIEQGNRFADIGVQGIDLLAYRHTGDPEKLAARFVKECKLPVVIAGSVDTRERIEIVNSINPFAFTMGSALFDQKFVKGASFRVNLEKVIEIMDAIKWR